MGEQIDFLLLGLARRPGFPLVYWAQSKVSGLGPSCLARSLPGDRIPIGYSLSTYGVYCKQQELAGRWKVQENIEMEVELDPHSSRQLQWRSPKGPVKTHTCTLSMWVSTH